MTPIIPIITATLLSVLCLILTGFCVKMMGRSYDSMRLALIREQASRAKDRLSAFRREQYLITLAYTAKPDLAAALANVPPPLEAEELPEEPMHFDGWGAGRTGK